MSYNPDDILFYSNSKIINQKFISQYKYYHKNKDKINETQRNNKKVCECGSSISPSKEKRHNGTKKHRNFVLRDVVPITGVKSIVQEARELFYIHYDPGENDTVNS